MKKMIAILLLAMLIACAAKETAPEQPKQQMEDIEIVTPIGAMPDKPQYEPPPTPPTENTT